LHIRQPNNAIRLQTHHKEIDFFKSTGAALT